MFTVTDALDLIDHVVEQGGEDHVSPNFYVTREGQPVCLLGRAFMLTGVSANTMKSWGNASILTLARSGLLPFPMTLGAIKVFSAAQKAQDGLTGEPEPGYKTWGLARRAAHRAAESFLELLPDSVLAAESKELVSV